MNLPKWRQAAVTARDITEQKMMEQRITMEYLITLFLAEAQTLEEAGPKVIQCICQTIKWDFGALWYVDPAQEVLRRDGVWHIDSEDLGKFEKISRQTLFPRGMELPGRVWKTNRSVWIADFARKSEFSRAPFAKEARLETALGVPIHIRGEVVGVMEFFSREGVEPDEKMIPLFDAIASQLGQFMERKRLEKEREEQAWALERKNRELARRQKIMLSLLEDLHAKRKLEEQKRSLEEANKRLAELNALKDELVTTVSHELRTPLTAIKETVGLFMDQMLGPINEEQRDFLNTLNANVDQLTELITNMLDLSKMELGRLRLARRKTAIGELVRKAVQHYKSLAGGRTIQIEISDEIPEVFVDPNRILQVLGNLFSNAVKFSPENGTIAFRASEKKGFVVLSVEDNGIGIAEEDFPKLFQKFSQLGEGKKRPAGTGLGLAVCKKLVELHQGEIAATSVRGKGSCFTFTVPIYTSKLAVGKPR